MIWWVELIGYLGMATILTSFAFRKMTVVRCINLVGCTISIIYGAIIVAYPIIALNSGIFIIHCIMLFIDYRKKNNLEPQVEDKSTD